MPNRFSRYTPGANYSPESFKDLAVVPIALRQRHDAALAAQDDMLLQLDNIQVRDEDREYYNQKRAEITDQVEGLTNKINSIGAGDSNLMGEFRNMKRSYNKEVSLSGGIGSAADLKKRIDDSRSKYLDFGVKQGWSPKKAQENFDIEYGNYNQKNPAGKLGEEGFAYGEFNPTFAPKQIEPLDIIAPIKGILGHISKDEGYSSYVPSYDANGNLSYKQVGSKKMSMENLKNLEDVTKWYNSKLNNPASPEMESLRYSRPGVDDATIRKDFLEEADHIVDFMKIQENGSMYTEQQHAASAGSSKKGKSEKESEVAELVSHSTGAEELPNKNYSSIYNGDEIAKYEAMEQQGPLSADDSAKKTLAIMQNTKLRQEFNKPENTKKINDYLNKDGYLSGVPKGANTVEVYRNTLLANKAKMQEIANSKEYKIAKNYQVLLNSTNVTLEDKKKANDNLNALGFKEADKAKYAAATTEYETRRRRIVDINDKLDEAYKAAEIPINDLQYSKLYTFGSSASDKDGTSVKVKASLDKSLNDNIGLDNLFTYINNGGGKFSDLGENEMVDKSNIDKFKNFAEAFKDENTKVEFDGIVDFGDTGSSQILLRYSKGVGNTIQTGRLALDYDNKNPDTNALDQFLNTMQGSLDSKGQAIIQSIKDNKTYKDLSVDNETFKTKGYSQSQTSKIKQYSKAIDDNVTRENPRFKEVDYISNFKDNNIILNDNGYYEMALRNSDKSTGVPLKTGQWFQKNFVREYRNGIYSTPNPLKPTSDTDRLNFVKSMFDTASQLTDDENGVMQIDDASPEFKKDREQYINLMNSTQDLKLQAQYSDTFYNAIKDKKIALKNKKRLL